MLSASTATAVRLCVEPLSLPFPEGDDRFALVQGKVTAPLLAAGFELAEPEAVSEVFEAIDEEWGDIFDPNTGRSIPEKSERLFLELERALRENLDCDARLKISLSILRAKYTSPNASWDGATRRMVSVERSVLNALGGTIEMGWVSASSLWVELSDLRGKPIAFRSAGVETLADLSFSRSLDRLPEDQWLRDEAFLDEAVESALGDKAIRLRTLGNLDKEIDSSVLSWPSL